MSDNGYYHVGNHVYRIGPNASLRSMSMVPVNTPNGLNVRVTFADEVVDFPISQFRIVTIAENDEVVDAAFNDNAESLPTITDKQRESLLAAAQLGDGHIAGTTFNGLRQLKLVDGKNLTDLGKRVIASIGG